MQLPPMMQPSIASKLRAGDGHDKDHVPEGKSVGSRRRLIRFMTPDLYHLFSSSLLLLLFSTAVPRLHVPVCMMPKNV